MEEECVELYGMTGTFFSTNKAYHIPYPVEKNFHPFPYMLPAADEEVTDTNIPARAPALTGEADEEGFGLASSGPTVAPVALDPPENDRATKTLIAKMRENAFEARRKKIELQELNLTKLWCLRNRCV
jgi:hypothetical protein